MSPARGAGLASKKIAKRRAGGIEKTKENIVSTVKSVAAAIPKVNFQNLFNDNPQPQKGPPLASPEVKSYMKRSLQREKARAGSTHNEDENGLHKAKLPMLKLVYFNSKGKGERYALLYHTVTYPLKTTVLKVGTSFMK